jgi:tRNA threonylcarbamoyladenosine biosynthesis protein TsaB
LNILLIDTATNTEIVAASSGNIVSDQTRKVDVSHSATLLESIDRAVKGIGIELSDLNVIGVGIGPGSFTGIRIALTTARMFAQVFELPLIGIKTHLIYALSAVGNANPGENILIAFDAKKDRVFGALYKMNEKDLYPDEIIEPGDYQIGYLLDNIRNKKKSVLIGDGCEKYYNEIKSGLPGHILFKNFQPSGEIICKLTGDIYSQDPELYRDFNRIIPFYSRKSDAEIMKYNKK